MEAPTERRLDLPPATPTEAAAPETAGSTVGWLKPGWRTLLLMLAFSAILALLVAMVR